MNFEEINTIRDQHDLICSAIVIALGEDKSLITEDDWVAHLIQESTVREFWCDSEYIYGRAEVYTNLTGGSYEHPRFKIPLDTLNKYL